MSNFAGIMANPLKQLAGETAIYGLSTILARVINFLFVPFYTRLLTTASYGVVTEFMAYIAVLQVVLVFQRVSLGLCSKCRLSRPDDMFCRTDSLDARIWWL